MTHLFASREVGAAAATRVRIASPHGSCFDGKRGIVVAFLPNGGVLVRFMGIPRYPHGLTLPFGRDELQEIA